MRKRFQLYMLKYPRYEKRELPSVFVTQPPCFDKDAFLDAVTSPPAAEDPAVLVAEDEYEEPLDSLALTLGKADCLCVSVDSGPTYVRVFGVLREAFESPEKRRERLKSLLKEDSAAAKKQQEILERKYRVKKRREEAVKGLMGRLEVLVDLFRENLIFRMIVGAILLALVLGVGFWMLNTFYGGGGGEGPVAEGRDLDLAALGEGVDPERAEALLDSAREAAERAAAEGPGASGEHGLPEGLGAGEGSRQVDPWSEEQLSGLRNQMDPERDTGDAGASELDDIFGSLVAQEEALSGPSAMLGELSSGMGALRADENAPAVVVIAMEFTDSFAEASRLTGGVLEAHHERPVMPSMRRPEREDSEGEVSEREEDAAEDLVQSLRSREHAQPSVPGTGPVARLVVGARDRLESISLADPEALQVPVHRYRALPDLPLPPAVAARAAELREALVACGAEESEAATRQRDAALDNPFFMAGVLYASGLCSDVRPSAGCADALERAGCAALQAALEEAFERRRALGDALAQRLLGCLDDEGVGHLLGEETVDALHIELERVTGFLPARWVEAGSFVTLDASRVEEFPCDLLPGAMREERPALLRHLHP